MQQSAGRGLVTWATFFVCVIVLCASISLCAAQSRPDYDHQNTTYIAQFKPVSVKSSMVTLQPFFAPDYSTNTQTELVNSATVSIDIQIPSFSSWSGCSWADEGSCMGCNATVLRNKETFSIWQALVNAQHRGVRVRVLTNRFDKDVVCKGMLTPLDYLFVAGADVRFFTTTSFTHSKYIAVDGNKAAISSINFSKTSMLKNREAGIIISGDSSGKLVAYTQSIFEYDFAQGLRHSPRSGYPQHVIDVCTDPTPIPVVTPNPHRFQCDSQSPRPDPITDRMDVELIASPDFAYESIMGPLKSAKKKLQASLYQITDDNFCQLLIDLNGKGVELQIFVSNSIFGTDDYFSAKRCYEKLFNAGVVVHKSVPKCLFYSHQKFWIIDDHDLYLSTGNWSPTDYPAGSNEYPPYPNSAWRKTNRNMTVRVSGNEAVLRRFQEVFSRDWDQSVPFDGKLRFLPSTD